MSTITDIPYEEHRLVVVAAVGFLVVALALPWHRARVQPIVLRALVVFLPTVVLAFVVGLVVTQIAWAGEQRLDMLPLSGAICALGWGTGLLLRLAIPRLALALVVLLPMLVVAGLLWVRDAPPALSATAATRAFASQAGVTHFRCHRFASGDDGDLYGLPRAIRVRLRPSSRVLRPAPRLPELIHFVRQERPHSHAGVARRAVANVAALWSCRQRPRHLVRGWIHTDRG